MVHDALLRPQAMSDKRVRAPKSWDSEDVTSTSRVLTRAEGNSVTKAALQRRQQQIAEAEQVRADADNAPRSNKALCGTRFSKPCARLWMGRGA